MMLNPKLLTSVIFAGAITLSGNTSNAPKDHMAISITAADAKVPFYARLTTGAKRLVLTSAAEATSETRKTFFLPRGHKAFVVEYLAPKGASPHGEQFRYANLGVLTAATFEEAETALHAIGEAAHPIEVSSELLVPSQNNSNLLAKFAPTSLASDPLPEISKEELQQLLEEFTGARSTTIASQQVTLGERSSASGRNQALAWLSERYQALGLTVKIRDYSSGKNFSAELPGSDPSRLLMVSSHYDTVNTVGADDNGAGTIAALLIAKALVNSGNVPTVLFVAFDQEERGLIGSKAMAKQMNASGELRNLDGVINLEMFGYDSDSDGAYHSIHCNENDSKILSDQFDKLVVEAGLPLKRVNACTNRSDHASFWAYDKPAIIISQNFFGGDANPCYHKACDQTKIINWDYYHRLTRASAGLARHFSQGTSVH